MAVSNDAKGHMGPPKFDAAAFQYSGGRLELKIKLTYLLDRADGMAADQLGFRFASGPGCGAGAVAQTALLTMTLGCVAPWRRALLCWHWG